MMPIDEGSPPGHPSFFVVSTTGDDIATDIAAVHNLEAALGRCPTAADIGHSQKPQHCGKSCCHILLHRLLELGLEMVKLTFTQIQLTIKKEVSA
jgi:hypothetical protein